MAKRIILCVLQVGIVWAYGNYKYCCEIKRCQLIESACRASTRLTGNLSCTEACLSDSSGCTVPPALSQRDYTCLDAYLEQGTPGSPLDLVCNQTYREGEPAAPDLFVSYDFCRSNCSGWKLSAANDPGSWAAPLLSYILPAVIFSMTVPRRQKWEVNDWLFDFDIDAMSNLPRILLSLLLAGVIVIADTAVWVFTIFAFAGPMLVGGMHEALLDYKIVAHLDDAVDQVSLQAKSGMDSNSRLRLNTEEKAELLLAVVAGNLDGCVNEPQEALGAAVAEMQRFPKRFPTQLLAMLTTQYSFGTIVGAPVLFYLGAFIYTLLDLASSSRGDRNIAHALSFGMWWMVIVHVAIISGCLLASNNPSTAAAIHAGSSAIDQSHTTAGNESSEEVTKSMRLSLGRRAVYHSHFMPVELWDRGYMKSRWLQNTHAWERHSWIQARLSLGFSWFAIALIAFLLIFIPGMLGAIVSYTTPIVGFSCRSLTITVYTSCQLVLILATTARGFYHAQSKETAVEALMDMERRTCTAIGGKEAGNDAFAVTAALAKGNIVLHDNPVDSKTGTPGDEEKLSCHEAKRGSVVTITKERSRFDTPSNIFEELVMIWKGLRKQSSPSWKLIAFIGACSVAGLAAVVSLFAGAGGTIMQILGVYANCACDVRAAHWFGTNRGISIINVSKDYQEQRDMSEKYWLWTGVAATIFMAVCTYAGWFYQRRLRHQFVEAANKLIT